MKKDYDQNIGLHEVFLESVPTALIITAIFRKASKGPRGKGKVSKKKEKNLMEFSSKGF